MVLFLVLIFKKIFSKIYKLKFSLKIIGYYNLDKKLIVYNFHITQFFIANYNNKFIGFSKLVITFLFY